MRTRRTKLLAIFATAGAIAAGAFFASRGQAETAVTAPSSPRRLVAPSLVEAHGDRVELAFEQGGLIAEIVADEGTVVHKGDVLARLQDRVDRARVSAAEAALAAAIARRQMAVNGPRKDELKAAIADAEAAKAQAWERGVSRDRAEALLAAEAFAAAEVDTARGAADATSAQARAAQARVSLLRKGTRREQVAEADAAVDAAQAQLEEARALLAQTELRAPSDGIVLRRLHEVGEHVTTMPPTTVLVIADISQLELRAEVDESDVDRVKLGQRGFATAEAYGDRPFAGRITQIVGELGRKTQRLDDPLSRVDTRVLEIVFTLDDAATLPLGLRMDVHLE